MGHTNPPLRIGFRNGVGYAYPKLFEREKGEVVEVKVETACSVRFDSQYFFSDKDYGGPQNAKWKPNHVDKDGTPTFDVVPYRYQVTGTHSIKIGSGRQRRAKKTRTKVTGKA